MFSLKYYLLFGFSLQWVKYMYRIAIIVLPKHNVVSVVLGALILWKKLL